MKCDACHKYEATVAYTQIADDDKKTLYLCSFCAAQTQPQKTDAGPSQAPTPSTPQPTVEPPAKKAIAKGSVLAPAGRTAVVCKGCGMSYSEFKKLGRLGCHQCYTAFEPELALLLKRLHDAQGHVGKGRIETPPEPATESSSPAEIERLRHELIEAVASEAYERAAELRDSIARLENHADNQGKAD